MSEPKKWPDYLRPLPSRTIINHDSLASRTHTALNQLIMRRRLHIVGSVTPVGPLERTVAHREDDCP